MPCLGEATAPAGPEGLYGGFSPYLQGLGGGALKPRRRSGLGRGQVTVVTPSDLLFKQLALAARWKMSFLGLTTDLLPEELIAW